MLKIADVAAALADLANIFPRARSQVANQRTAELYHDALKRHTAETLEGGVRVWCSRGERFPTPGQLNSACWDYVKATNVELESQRESYDAKPYSCRVCRATPRLARLRVDRGDGEMVMTRYVIACDPAKHKDGDRRIPMPANFVEWAERAKTPEELEAAPLQRDVMLAKSNPDGPVHPSVRAYLAGVGKDIA